MSFGDLILDALRDGERRGLIKDANETLLFKRQMEHIYTTVYDKVFQDYKYRQFLSVSHEVPNWAETHTYRERVRIGAVKRVNTFAAKDFPNVEIEGSETTAKIFSWGDSYGYTIQEMRASAALGTNLEATRANAAREAMEDQFDALACTGDTDSGLKGLANAANALDASTNVTADWSLTATSVATILSDLGKWQRAQRAQAGNKESLTADTLLLSTAAYNRLATEFVASSFASDVTLLQLILKGNPWLKRIEAWPRLDTADGSGGPRCVLFKNSPEVAELVIPQEFEQFAPQLDGQRYTIMCHARNAGVKSIRPVGISFSDVAGG